MNSDAEASSTSGTGAVMARGLAPPFKLVRFPATYQQHLVDPVGGNHTRSELQRPLKSQPERHDGVVVPPQRPLPVVREPPHTEIEQPRGARRHAVDGAALEGQAMLPQLLGQPLGLVATLVTNEIIERRPHGRM